MSDFWFGFVMFLAGVISCFGVFFVLCYLPEIRDAIGLLKWDAKYYWNKWVIKR